MVCKALAHHASIPLTACRVGTGQRGELLIFQLRALLPSSPEHLRLAGMFAAASKV